VAQIAEFAPGGGATHSIIDCPKFGIRGKILQNKTDKFDSSSVGWHSFLLHHY
jgi:hypothetical protein